MRKKISGIFGLLVLALLLAVGISGGMVKAGDVEEGSGGTTNEKTKLEIEWSNTKLTYNKEPQTPTAKIKGSDKEINIKVTVEGEHTNVGNYTAIASIDNNDEYEIEEKSAKTGFEISPKRLEVTWKNTTLIYNGTNLKPDAEINRDDIIDGDTVEITVTGERKEVGNNYEARASINNNNYVLEPATSLFSIVPDDSSKPQIKGIDKGKTYCEKATFSVTGENIVSIKINDGENVFEKNKETYTIEGEGENIKYTISVMDSQNKETSITITVNKNHEYGEPKYKWANDNSSATAVMICRNDSSHTQSYELGVNSKITKQATCAANGEVTYTANASIGGKEYKNVKIVTSNKNPQNHVGGTKTVNAKSATCTAKGYTGDTVCASCSVQRERGTEIPAKGYKWNKGKATKKSTEKSEGIFTYTCTNSCRHTKTEIIPRKSITVDLGKKAKVISKASGCKMSLANASKYKKYLTFNAKTGEVKTKKYYKVKINKSIPVKVKIGGKNYTVKVKIKIPAPNVKIIKKKVGSKGYRYIFKYNIKGANKIQVRMQKGGTKAINKYLDKNVSKQKSNKGSYINFTKSTMKKMNNKVTFKIVVYYGKNQSETLTITK